MHILHAWPFEPTLCQRARTRKTDADTRRVTGLQLMAARVEISSFPRFASLQAAFVSSPLALSSHILSHRIVSIMIGRVGSS